MPTFDCKKWPIQRYNLTPAPTTYSAGRGLGGFRQVRSTSNGYWRGTIDIAPMFGLDLIDFKGFLFSLEGSSGVFDLPICDPYVFDPSTLTYEQWLERQGYVIANLAGPVGGVYMEPFSDGQFYSDGTGFVLSPYSAPAPSSDVLSGASQIELVSVSGMVRGSYFSTPDNFLHIVTEVNGSIISFAPPLRADLTAGTLLEFKDPMIRVRLSDDASGSPTTEFHRWSSGEQISIEEVMER